MGARCAHDLMIEAGWMIGSKRVGGRDAEFGDEVRHRASSLDSSLFRLGP